MNSHYETLKARESFINNLMDSSVCTEDIIFSYSKLYYFLFRLSQKTEIQKKDIEAFRRKSLHVYDAIDSLKDPVLKVILPKVTILLTKLLSNMAKVCLYSGSPALASDIYELIGDIHLKASDISRFRFNSFITLELKSPATFWYLKADNTSFGRHTINRKVFTAYAYTHLKHHYKSDEKKTPKIEDIKFICEELDNTLPSDQIYSKKFTEKGEIIIERQPYQSIMKFYRNELSKSLKSIDKAEKISHDTIKKLSFSSEQTDDFSSIFLYRKIEEKKECFI
jgi:hypothetical protein